MPVTSRTLKILCLFVGFSTPLLTGCGGEDDDSAANQGKISHDASTAQDLGRLGGRSVATALLSTATDKDALRSGAEEFTSGNRVDPRIR